MLTLARSLVTVVGLTVIVPSVMIVPSVIVTGFAVTSDVRHIHNHLLITMIVRAIRMSVMHTTTQQCVKHYGGHRRIGEEFMKHGRFVRT